jgi:hypothetical protein
LHKYFIFLRSVLYARDKWLRKDDQGHMYPSVAYLYASPCEMQAYLSEHLSFWSDYYSLSYEPLMKIYRQLLLEKPVIEHIRPEQLLDDEKILASFDLKTVRAQDLESIQGFNITYRATRAGNLHGFAFWFDVVFTTDDDVVTLSTSPASPETHWKQTIALLPEALDLFVQSEERKRSGGASSNSLALNEDDSFECFIIMNQADDNPRHYQIDIGVSLGEPENDHDEEEDEEDEEVVVEEEEEHPTPCDCGKIRCMIISAALAKYEKEAKESV